MDASSVGPAPTDDQICREGPIKRSGVVDTSSLQQSKQRQRACLDGSGASGNLSADTQQ
jgi:hypothetical protein